LRQSSENEFFVSTPAQLELADITICDAGSTIIDFAGSLPTAILSECNFIDNNVALGNETSASFWTQEAPDVQSQYTVTRLHNCTFSGNLFDIELVCIKTHVEHQDDSAFITSYPYDARLWVSHTVKADYDADFWEYLPDSKTIDGLTIPASRRYIDATSTWFLEVQEVRFSCHSSM
jgi:hypothetical protein